jgi:hypothetical protein
VRILRRETRFRLEDEEVDVKDASDLVPGAEAILFSGVSSVRLQVSDEEDALSTWGKGDVKYVADSTPVSILSVVGQFGHTEGRLDEQSHQRVLRVRIADGPYKGRTGRIGSAYLVPMPRIKRKTGRQYVILGTPDRSPAVSVASFEREEQQSVPCPLVFPSDSLPLNRRNYWIFRDALYSTVSDLQPAEVRALITEAEKKQKAKIDRAVGSEQQSEGDQNGRQPIPDDVKLFVWRRDSGRCVKCGSTVKLEFDHIIPITMGGSNTARNLQLLCEACNRAKGGGLL